MAKFRVSTARRKDTNHVLPLAVLNCLPFSLESIGNWAPENDLYKFIYHLLDSESTVEDENGNVRISNYNNLTPEYFIRGKRKAETWVSSLTESFNRDMQSREFKDLDPEFGKSLLFGKAAKYMIAWERIIADTLEESLFFSISHALESEFDINCSLYLATNFYYKQAMQVMRSFLESLILPIHFCESPIEFESWKTNNYRTPPVRGKNGILSKLLAKNVLPYMLATETDILYGELNSYIHGSENSFISKGIFQGNYLGYGYNDRDFSAWCNYIGRTIELGIKLLSINLDQWRADLSSRETRICDICHGSNLTTEVDYFGGRKSYKYICLDCPNSQVVS